MKLGRLQWMSWFPLFCFATILHAAQDRMSIVDNDQYLLQPLATKIDLTRNNTCGSQHNGAMCDPTAPGGGWCCSKNGWCGNGFLYCGVGCQPEYGKCDLAKQSNRPINVNFCGSSYGGHTCTTSDCCSANGLCGTGDEFCGLGCQPSYGSCDSTSQDSPRASLCGPENNDQRCPTFQCCSKDGICGNGKDFCSVPEQCMPQYGWCDSAASPAGYNTTRDDRLMESSTPYGVMISQCKTPKTIALTYDDGPSEYTEKLLDILLEYGATATFFVAGNTRGRGQIDDTNKWIEIIKRMDAEGHQVGSHTWSHPNLNELKSDERREEMVKNERAIINIIGKYPTYMRPPYVRCDEECQKDMGSLGYHVIGWSTDSTDTENPEDLNAMITAWDAGFYPLDLQLGNMLFIQHDTIETSAIDLTRHVLCDIKRKGWKAVSVGECLGESREAWYRQPDFVTSDSIAEDGCIVSGNGFCGVIDRFKNKVDCFKSSSKCYKQAAICSKNGKLSNECRSMKAICRMQLAFCTECGSQRKPCLSADFRFGVEALH